MKAKEDRLGYYAACCGVSGSPDARHSAHRGTRPMERGQKKERSLLDCCRGPFPSWDYHPVRDKLPKIEIRNNKSIGCSVINQNAPDSHLVRSAPSRSGGSQIRNLVQMLTSPLLWYRTSPPILRIQDNTISNPESKRYTSCARRFEGAILCPPRLLFNDGFGSKRR